ncbi:hypothetical protein ABPG74_010381 [Tetrahymena malaccensis]
MSDENEECIKCHSQKVRHDRIKGNVKCFSCGYVVESHYKTFEQEVNNYENDPDQMNKMRGLVQDGKDIVLKIGRDVFDEQTGKKKRKADEDDKKNIRKQLNKWCEYLQFEKREIFEIENYFNILQNMDYCNPNQTKEKEANSSQLKRRGVIAIYIFVRLLKIDEAMLNLKSICNVAGVKLEDVEKELENIKKTQFEDKQKIVEILFDKVDLKTYAEEYSKQLSLNENDKKGYLALCQQIKESQISNGEQDQTKAAAALYAVTKLSNNPDLNNKTLKDLSKVCEKSDGTIKKFYENSILPNLITLFNGIKYQQYNWKDYSNLSKN